MQYIKRKIPILIVTMVALLAGLLLSYTRWPDMRGQAQEPPEIRAASRFSIFQEEPVLPNSSG